MTIQHSRIHRLIGVALAVAIGLSACGDDSSETSPTTAVPTTVAPTTAVPATTAASVAATTDSTAPVDETASSTSPATEPTEPESFGSPEADAAAAAWALAFDSEVTFDKKSAHIAEADALQATIESYTSAGSAMDGITLKPTAVAVDGTTATVTYDVFFGDAPAYTDLTGAIELADGTWVVSRDEFCGFMASARNACPA